MTERQREENNTMKHRDWKRERQRGSETRREKEVES
jgi:hypothetical protein